jgi:hypothetical protein
MQRFHICLLYRLAGEFNPPEGLVPFIWQEVLKLKDSLIEQRVPLEVVVGFLTLLLDYNFSRDNIFPEGPSGFSTLRQRVEGLQHADWDIVRAEMILCDVCAGRLKFALNEKIE